MYANFNQICKNEARKILWKNRKKYDPKIETVKYLELIDQNRIWLIFNADSKLYKFPGHISSHSILFIFDQILDL